MSIFKKFKEVAESSLDFVKDAAENSFDTAKEAAESSFDKLKVAAESSLDIAKEAAGSSFDFVKDAAESSVDFAVNKISDIKKNVEGTEQKEIKFNENQLIDIYGLLFKIAYVDGGLDKDELRKIYEIMNTEGFSERGKLEIQNYLVEEPDVEEIIENIKKDEKEIKHIAYLNSIEISICNDEINAVQQEQLSRLKNEFGITDDQNLEMRKFAQKAKEIADRGIDDKFAEDALMTGIAGLSAVGVPIAAVYFSGSVIGLSAAGITSGLAAIGLGFGMIPGIGVAVVIGAVIFMALTNVFDVGGKNAKQKAQAEKERRAEQVIKNLQDTINHLIDRIAELERKAQDANANKEAIYKLQETIRKLRQIQTAKKQGVASC